MVEAVLFAIHGSLLPLVTDTMLIAEQFRRCAMGASRRIGGGDPARVSSLLSGKDAAGAPLTDHRHAYFLPLDRDGDGRIDHVLVRSAAGFGREDQLALAGVRALWPSRGKPGVQVVSVASGEAKYLLETSRFWTSATPFVTARHHRPARGELDVWLEGELRRALEQHGLPAPSRVERVPELRREASGQSKRWIEFRRARKGDDQRLGHGFRLEFPAEVRGPFAVGYGSHFGLGVFRKE